MTSPNVAGVIMGGAGFMPDAIWLSCAVHYYEELTGVKPTRLHIVPTVAKALLHTISKGTLAVRSSACLEAE